MKRARTQPGNPGLMESSGDADARKSSTEKDCAVWEPHRLFRWFVVALIIAVPCRAADEPQADPTINAEGDAGRTSYLTVPFSSDVIQLAWGSTGGLSPCNLHWESGTAFTNPATVATALSVSRGLAARGIVPFSGAQRWQDTFVAAQPPLPGEPPWVTADRKANNMLGRGDYQAWVAWEKAHSNLFMMNADGTQAGSTRGAWFGNWGHISPLMPLPRQDWPPGRTNVTYGEWYAYKWGQTARRTGACGIMLSDFADSQPHLLSYETGFNPEIIAGFEASIQRTIPGNSIAAKSAYINANLFPQWTDYLCEGYARYFGQLAAELKSNTGHESLVIDQGSRYPSILRLYGVDDRIIAASMPRKNFLHASWDALTMSPERGGESMIYGIGGSVIAAAREPNARVGANMSADDPAYWEAVEKFWGGNHPALAGNEKLTAGDLPAALAERGYKELTRAWLEHGWAHIADREGRTRRALCHLSRYYWDQGKLDPEVKKLIQTVIPTRPFGFAIYYSCDVERKAEAGVPGKGISTAYYDPDLLVNFKNGGGVASYYVSDAGLSKLRPESRPAAWIILDRPDLISVAERKQLESVAPILTSLEEARNFSNAPLSFSTGLTGNGFYDQNNRLIVIVSNPNPAGVEIDDGSMNLKGLPAGDYIVIEQFSQAQTRFTVDASGCARIPLKVARWDTLVFAITRS